MHNRKRPSFFSAPALVTMALLVAIALYVLHPRKSFFENLDNVETPDALSLAYLDVLLNADPDNIPLRLSFARMQAAAGQATSARETLAPLTNSPRPPIEALELKLVLLAQDIAATTEPAPRASLQSEFLRRVRQLIRHPDMAAHGTRVLRSHLNWLTPTQQLALLPEAIANSTADDRLWLTQTLAQAQVAAGNPGAGAETLQSIVGELPAPDRVAVREKMIRLYLAAEKPAKALAAFQAMGRPDQSARSLRQGVRLANLAGNHLKEREWLSALAALESDNLAVLRRLLTLQLADNDLQGALSTAENMLTQSSALTDRDTALLARVFEWNNRPEQALPLWHRTYRTTASDESFNRATTLARELFQWRTLIRILELAERRNRLDANDYLLLAETQIRLSELDNAVRDLELGVARYPQHEPLAQRLSQLYINNRRYREAIALFESRPDLSERERLVLANLYWRTRAPEQALATLNVPFATPNYRNEAVVMRLDLAAMLGRRDVLEQEYQAIRRLPQDELDSELLERMLNLAITFGDYDQAQVYGQMRYQASGNPRYLAILADLQASKDQWRELGRTLARWRHTDPATDDDPRYWVLLARVQQHQGNADDAEQAYRKALALAPSSPSVLDAWSWFLLAHPERLPGELPSLLHQLAHNPAPEHLSLLAYGHNALGNKRDALMWSNRLRQAGPASFRAQMEQADLLAALGADAIAFQRRREAAALPESPSAPRTPSRRRPEPETNAPPAPPRFADTNRSVQVGAQRQDIGRLSLHHRYGALEYSTDDYRIGAFVSSIDAEDDTLFTDPVAPAPDVRLELQNNHRHWRWTLGIGRLDRLGSDDIWGTASVRFRPSDRWSFGAGHYVGERALDSAESWWLVRKDRTSFDTRYTPVPRIELAVRYDDLAYRTASQGQIAHGSELNLETSYRLFHAGPAWIVRAEYNHQSLTDLVPLDEDAQAALTPPLPTTALLTQDYERIGIGSRWQEGDPHGLYEFGVRPSWFFDVSAGYVLSTSSTDLGVNAGLGWPVTGNDELALSAGFSSDSLDGESRINLRLSYTLFFAD